MLPRKPLTFYSPMHKTSRTIAEILSVIEAAIEVDGPGAIEPGSIDTRGLTIVADGYSYRLEITDEAIRYPTQDAWEGTRTDDDQSHDAFIGGDDEPYIEPPF